MATKMISELDLPTLPLNGGGLLEVEDSAYTENIQITLDQIAGYTFTTQVQPQLVSITASITDLDDRVTTLEAGGNLADLIARVDVLEDQVDDVEAVLASKADVTWVNSQLNAYVLTTTFTGALAQKADLSLVVAELANKAPLAHTHVIGDTTGLQDALNAKAPLNHTHTIAQVTGLQSELDSKVEADHDWAITDVTGLQTALDAKASQAELDAHESRTDNPHSVTKAQVGLGNVDNTSDSSKPVSTATQTALDLKVNVSSLAPVATSGDYDDLTNAPTLGSAASSDVTDFATASQGTKADTALQEIESGSPNVSIDTTDPLRPIISVSQSSTTVEWGDIDGALDDQLDLKAALDAKASITYVDSELATKSDVGHTHVIADTTGLQAALDAKAATVHSHAISDVTGLQSTLDDKVEADHVWAISNVTNLQTTLDAKAPIARTISAGTGLSGGGDLTANRTISLSSGTIASLLLADTSLQAASIGVTVQAYDAALQSISGLTTSANQGIYATASDTYATYSLTAAGRALAAVAGTANTIPYFSASNTVTLQAVTTGGRALLNNAGTINTFPYYSASNVVTLGSITAFGRSLVDDADAAAARTTLGLVIGTNVQAYSANLTSWAAITPAAKADAVHNHTTSDITNLSSYTGFDSKYVAQTALGTTVATLVSGKIPTSQLPAIALSEPFVVSSQVAQLALTAQQGDVAIRTDIGKNYIHNGGTAGTMADWNELEGGVGAVSSVNGQTGAVVLDAADVGAAATSHTHSIANVTGLQTALDGKAPTSHTHTIAQVTNLQTTLDGKAPLSHTHTIANVTGLQTALDGKAATTHTHAISDVTGLQTQLTAAAATTAEVFAARDGGSTLSERFDRYGEYIYNELAPPTTLPTGTRWLNRETGLLFHLHEQEATKMWVQWNSPLTRVSVSGGEGTVEWGDIGGTLSSQSDLAAVLSGKANTSHTHTISQITNLQTSLNAKADSSSLATVATSGAYNDLTGKPTIFSGAYADLTGKPTLFSGAYADLTGKPTLATVATSGAYSDLTGTPSIFSGNYNDLSNAPVLGTAAAAAETDFATAAQGTKADTAIQSITAGTNILIDDSDPLNLIISASGSGGGGSDPVWGFITGDIANQVDLVSALGAKADSSSLATVATSGAYNDLTGKPTLFSGAYADLTGKPTLFSGSWNDLQDLPDTISGFGITDAVPETREVAAGTGLWGGGDLTSNRTISLSAGSIDSLALADSALQPAEIGVTIQSFSTNLELWSAIDPADKAETVHTHVIADVSGLQGELDGIISYVDSQNSTQNTQIQLRKMRTPQSLSVSGVSLTPNPATYELYVFDAMSANTTINAPSATPGNGHALEFRFTDNGTSRTITWNAVFRAVGTALPTATVSNKVLYVGTKWNANASKWDVLAVRQEA